MNSTAILLASSLLLGPASQPALPAVGDIVPAFEAVGLDGNPVKIDYAKGSSTVLFFFLSGCPSCHKMIPVWNRGFERKPQALRAYGVLLDKEPPGFFTATPISFPVLRGPGGEFNRTYKLNRVPITLRVGPGGRVLDVGVGPVDAIRLGQLLQP